MSDFVLSAIPTDPHWQPGKPAADRAAALAAQLTHCPVRPARSGGTEVVITWHDRVAAVPSGDCLQRIRCSRCGLDINTQWYGRLLEERVDVGFDDLSAQVPCCGAEVPVDTLDYDWPCGFARFEIEIWNPYQADPFPDDRYPPEWFTPGELDTLGGALGHPARQIWAHI